MKPLILCFVLSLTASTAAAQEVPSNSPSDVVNGPVKTIECGRIEYQLQQGKPVEGKRIVDSRTIFDEHRNRTEQTTYREDGEISSKLVYTYDVLGRNTGYDEYYRIKNEPFGEPSKNIYTLDDQGRIVENLRYERGGAISSKFTYRYDSRGNKLEENFLGWAGTSMGRLVYTYDEGGRQLTQTSYDRDDVPASKSVSSYDAEGRQIEWVQYQSGVLRYKRLFKYDEQGRITEQETSEFNKPRNVFTSHAPVPGKIVYRYDDHERSKEIAMYDPEGNLKSREVRTLDEKGIEIGWAVYTADGSPRHNEIGWQEKNKIVETLKVKAARKIEYDSRGNWIKQTQLTLPAGATEVEPYYAQYRTITFYD